MGAHYILHGIGQFGAEICHNEPRARRIKEVIDEVHESFVQFFDLVGWLHLEPFDGNIDLLIHLLPSILLTEGGAKCGRACGRVQL